MTHKIDYPSEDSDVPAYLSSNMQMQVLVLHAHSFCSAESISRSRSPLSERDVCRMECNNRMSSSSTSLDAENNQCKNCITLASRVKSLSSEIESLREKIEKIECNNMPSSKPMMTMSLLGSRFTCK